MKSIISVENLIFEYPQGEECEAIRAVDGVNLEIEEGSFVAIVGQNGSGKSSLAKNLNGLLVPTSGSVKVKGIDTKDDETIWELRQNIGMVFQNPDNQIVSSIVEDDVAFGPENLGINPLEIRDIVDEALDSVWMGDYKKKAPHLLSGGQKQRIAIAGVIAMKPSCIVFDEPTAMLDPQGRRDVMKIIKELNVEGITIVLITHFMEEALQAERIIVMEDGKIVMDDSPYKIFDNIEKVRAVGLELPVIIKLISELRKNGIDVPKNIFDIEGMVNYICQ
ncbi:MAG: energy-coupling factor transporter ATPase [Clostridiales bacterium]|jgi:energy-coupling factor transport system ATP-binding protein|nr:energy-coupling factor transporter ATPase [Clostridiales bacterium]